MQYWFEYRFPLNLLVDLGNLCLILIIAYFFLQKYKVSVTLKLILLLSCFTPFLFNGLMIDWYVFPDQSKYLRSASNCRNFNCQSTATSMLTSGIIYAFSPLISFEGLKSIAFINRLFLILLILFLYLKKFDKFFLFVLIFFPGLVLYSSISLRDTLVIILSILSFYNFFEKKYLIFLIVIILLFLIKLETAIYIFLLLFIYSLIFIIKKKYFFKIIALIILTYFLTNYLWTILETLNERRLGFFHEEFDDISNFQALNFTDLIFSVPKTIMLFLASPLYGIINFQMFFVLIDTIILYAFSIIIFIKNINKNLYKSIFWILALMGLSALHGLLVFNDGTIHRYKIMIIIPILFSYLYSLKKND